MTYKYEYEAAFKIRDKVWIDSDKSITGTVISVRFWRVDACYYQVEWFNDGRVCSHEFCEWQLSAVTK